MMCPSSEQDSRLQVPTEEPEYSPAERAQLLRLAHDSIESAFNGRALDLIPPSPHLSQPRGAFTTLHLHGKLRGCIGYVFPVGALYRTVAETAHSAAFDDPRFPPVEHSETPELKIEISVLSLPRLIRPEHVEVGKHGLVVTMGGRRGLLLPQVPVEWGWDRETFLSQTCLKAGLPATAWHEGPELRAFTAEVFADQ
jgi:AmmeMemoRadiSam system protein A